MENTNFSPGQMMIPKKCFFTKGVGVHKHKLASFVQEVLAIAQSDKGWYDLEYAWKELPEFFEAEDE